MDFSNFTGVQKWMYIWDQLGYFEYFRHFHTFAEFLRMHTE